jgi:hypothetical protein
MADTNKQPKAYSLSPTVIQWVSEKSSKLELETGEKISDSLLVDTILTQAMQEEARIRKLMDRVFQPKVQQVKRQKQS